MVYLNLFADINVYLYIYMYLYNTTLIALFYVFFSIINFNFKTLYSFSNFNFEFFNLFFLSLCLFSMAGVPPFIGFFSKIFIVNLLVNFNFFLLYFLFFLLLMLGLYFYIQNIRFLHTTSTATTFLQRSYFFTERVLTFYYVYLFFISLNLIGGFVVMDDLLLLFT